MSTSEKVLAALSIRQFHEFGFNLIPVKNKQPVFVEQGRVLPTPTGTYTMEKFGPLPWAAAGYQNEPLAWDVIAGMPWGYAAGAGGICGVNGMVCIDIDKVEDATLLAQLLNDLALPANYPWVVRSGSLKGYHIWVTCHELDLGGKGRLDNPAIGGGHVEIRYTGHYALLPPSRHPSMEYYKFVNGAFPSGPPAVVGSNRLMRAYSNATVAKQESTPPPKPARKPEPEADGAAYVSRAIESELAILEGTGEGGRNAQLYQSALKLGGYVGQGGLTRGQVETDLLYVAGQIGLTTSEAKATIRSDLDNARPSTYRLDSWLYCLYPITHSLLWIVFLLSIKPG